MRGFLEFARSPRFCKHILPVRPSSIPCLLFWSCPTTIFWFVVAIVVDALYPTSCWPASHVSKKVFELKPSPTDFDSARAIAIIGAIIGICASLNHRIPHAIFWPSLAALICSMFQISINSQIAGKATATFSSPVKQKTTFYDCPIPAFTFAEPLGLSSAIICRPFENKQSPKVPTSQINHSHSLILLWRAES